MKFPAILFAFSLIASSVAFPVAAQDLAAPMPGGDAVVVAEDVGVDDGEDEGGLTGNVQVEGQYENARIAIPAFAAERDVPTAANSAGTAALGVELARVITANLRNNGLFDPTGPDALPRPTYPHITDPQWGTWASLGAEMLVHGYVRAQPDGRLVVGCYLYDMALRDELARSGWIVQPGDWRRAAHKCSDLVYSRLTGEDPFFDSRIAYIAETGPKGNRVKRLAVMDSDGANHRFLTLGSSTALTPKYSPNYRQLLYLSYVDGNPRIYIYDIDSGRQQLVTQSSNPTFAPRWSPDGRWILYSMAVNGNTDIYRVSSSGGPSVRLTDAPGIDIGGSYSPDGSRIVFESDRSGSQQIYVMDANGTDQRRLSFFGGRAATPEWSPRGDQIAFTYIPGDFNIAVMSPNGRNFRKLTNAWQDEAPTWSPNGRIIQFFRTERNSGKTAIYQVDLTGENERRLPTPVNASDPAWGPILP